MALKSWSHIGVCCSDNVASLYDLSEERLEGVRRLLSSAGS
jgi:hypothetical protein